MTELSVCRSISCEAISDGQHDSCPICGAPIDTGWREANGTVVTLLDGRYAVRQAPDGTIDDSQVPWQRRLT